MGRGTQCISETAIGPDGAVYRRGRRRATPGSFYFPPLEIELRHLSAAVDEVIDALKLAASTTLTVRAGRKPLGGWWVVDGLESVLDRRTLHKDAVESATAKLERAKSGGLLTVHPPTETGTPTIKKIAGYAGEPADPPTLQLALEPAATGADQEWLSAYVNGRRLGAVTSAEVEAARRIISHEQGRYSEYLHGVPKLAFDSAGRVDHDHLLISIEQIR